jgi:hypothetical protein
MEARPMQINKGEQILDALLELGYLIEITDEGKITATDGEHTLLGKAEHESIEWEGRYPAYRVLERAYISKLRGRINKHYQEASSRHTKSAASPAARQQS